MRVRPEAGAANAEYAWRVTQHQNQSHGFDSTPSKWCFCWQLTLSGNNCLPNPALSRHCSTPGHLHPFPNVPTRAAGRGQSARPAKGEFDRSVTSNTVVTRAKQYLGRQLLQRTFHEQRCASACVRIGCQCLHMLRGVEHELEGALSALQPLSHRRGLRRKRRGSEQIGQQTGLMLLAATKQTDYK